MTKMSILKQLSKGESLIKLKPLFTKNEFSVPNLILLCFDEWVTDKDKCLDLIQKEFGFKKIAVRSSAADEDGDCKTRAGEYESILDVSVESLKDLNFSISSVFDSYVIKNGSAKGQHLILQEMVESVVVSGVIFTYELNSGAPYYVINYDDISGTTNSVTSGSGKYSNRTLYVHRGALGNVRSQRFYNLLNTVQKLEDIVENKFLDIEFAIDKDFQPYLLQVRPISTKASWSKHLVESIDIELREVQSFVRERFKPQFGVFGKTTVLGQMPDWNPAEMIGRAPRALSLSLYRRLITDDAWRVARESMGYAVPGGQPLMVSLAGQPFIDTRLSFHSYLPANLSPKISGKLVDFWVERLREHPELDDKVEFDVAITTFSFDIDELMSIQASCLDDNERSLFRESLLSLTRSLVQGKGEGSISAALSRIERLNSEELPEPSSGLVGLNYLLEKCIRNGTIPFSILARHGFIAHSILLSLKRCGVFDSEEVASLQGSVQTIAGDFLRDIHALQRGIMPHADFMTRYGHLRPGTYDILSPRYDQMEKFDFTSNRSHVSEKHVEKFCLTLEQRSAIDALLVKEGFLEIDSDGLVEYIKTATAGREYGKFVFTRLVSVMLELIAAYGEDHGLSREEMSHVPLHEILEIGKESSRDRSVDDRLREVAEQNAERHDLTTAIRLPQVLSDEAGVHVVPFQVSQPNFITSHQVTADAVYLDLEQSTFDLSDRIVLIENADPGFDWIFAQSIAGLVTMYGGANSHMAIRCAEFGIPAAIGCGQQRFESLVKATRLSLDCAVGLVMPVHLEGY